MDYDLLHAFQRKSIQAACAIQIRRSRALLKGGLAKGSEHFRTTAANHFKTLLEQGEISFDAAVPYLESLVDGETKRVVNYHLYIILAEYATAFPDIAGHLIEKAVSGELKSLDAGGREIWHPTEFSKSLRAVEQAGPKYAERIAKVQASMETHKKSGRIYDIPDFQLVPNCLLTSITSSVKH